MKHKLKPGNVVLIWYYGKLCFGVIDSLMVWKNEDLELEMPAYTVLMEDKSYVMKRESQMYSVMDIASKYEYVNGRVRRRLV
jgi:hypothetical protein